MALPVDPEDIKEEFLEYVKNNPLTSICDLAPKERLPFFSGHPVQPEWMEEARKIKQAKASSEIAILRPQNMAKIVNVEPRQQGKSFRNAITELGKSILRLGETSRDAASTTQAQSDALNAISKHIHIKNEQEFKKLYLGTFETEKKMSGSYPVRIEAISLDHKGGTKSYHITKVTNQNGKSLVIYRWGKTGAFGEVMTEKFESASAADKAFEKKLGTKMKGGYSPDAQHDPMPVDVNDFDGLRKKLGRPTMARLGPDHISHIDGDVDTSGVKDAETPRIGEDGRLNPQAEAEKRKRLEEEKRKARKEMERRQQQEYEAAYTANPNFGAF
ncbi:WGR domain-containing protein [Phaeobacter gallaeciensis]|uniref:WGR domain-containing protein n=1 Tax=Phaeobacter gallaeciensis TaxID=60890 RepID=UPI00237FE146|nr:WGR domain-containing protein [Phaeobacter gallaeciensis]MDE4297067.1 WGR domain-containing protein [Phaeobacter gallaeciensis]